jgi:hypothetical protein
MNIACAARAAGNKKKKIEFEAQNEKVSFRLLSAA